MASESKPIKFFAFDPPIWAHPLGIQELSENKLELRCREDSQTLHHLQWALR